MFNDIQLCVNGGKVFPLNTMTKQQAIALNRAMASLGNWTKIKENDLYEIIVPRIQTVSLIYPMKSINIYQVSSVV